MESHLNIGYVGCSITRRGRVTIPIKFWSNIGEDSIASWLLPQQDYGKEDYHDEVTLALETKMNSKSWIRSGDMVRSSDIKDFVTKRLKIISNTITGLISAVDSLFIETMLTMLEENNPKYIIVTKMDAVLSQKLELSKKVSNELLH